MERMDTLPEDCTLLVNGTEDGRTWSRWTDTATDYLVVYDPASREETCWRIGAAPQPTSA